MFARHLIHCFGWSGQELCETPGEGGGGGTDWPEYETPSGVGEGQAPEQQQPPARQPGSGQAPVQGQPGGDTREGQPPAGGQPRGGQPGGGRNLPQYRLDQIDERDREAARAAEETRIGELVNKGVRDTLAKALGLDGGTPPEDPRSARLRDTIYSLLPGLKELLARHKDVLGFVDAAPALGETNKAYWQGVAARSVETLHSGVARLLLGPDKGSKDLDPEIADDIRDQFIRWVEADKTGGRVQRYESQDANLVPEYLRVFQTRYLDPARRSAAVNVATRGQQRQRQPQQGPSGVPPAQQPPVPDLNNEDQVHGRAWAVLQQLRGQ